MRDFLKQNNLTFIDHDIETSRTARNSYHALNGRGVPLLVVNDRIVRGYNTRAVIKALKAPLSIAVL